MKKSNQGCSIKCSIIILNYQGEKVIAETVNSVLNSDFNKNNYEIIIVDNCSTDNSRTIIDKLVTKLPNNIRKLYLDTNHGFAGGNNPGIKIARGKYVVLLNNDCVVDIDWLSYLYKTITSSSNIFSVTSKLLIYPKYFKLELPIETLDVLTSCTLVSSHFLKFSKNNKINIPVDFLKQIELNVPFDSKQDKQIKLELCFADSPSTELCSQIKRIDFIKKIFIKDKTIQITIDIQNKYIIDNAFNKVQNAGTMVFQDGYARDIGAKVSQNHQDYEIDNTQYHEQLPVYAFCGAAVMLNVHILKKIGYLDETFFMYYEDVEISERARLAGYQNIFCPKAISRHLHAFSSLEWSPFFIYNVERGRLVHTFYHFPLTVFIKEYIVFLGKSIVIFLKSFNQNTINTTNLNVSTNIISSLPKLSRTKLKYSRIYQTNAINKNYKNIINGYWYTL